jgi:hypothetical protein
MLKSPLPEQATDDGITEAATLLRGLLAESGGGANAAPRAGSVRGQGRTLPFGKAGGQRADRG